MIKIPVFTPAIFYPTGAAAARAVLPRLLGAGASFVKRRPILSGLGVLIGYEYLDESDQPLAQVDIPGADELAKALDAAGIALLSAAEALGNATLEVIEGAGSALVRGIEITYDTVRNKLRGREDDVIAGFTVGFIALLTMTYLYQSVKRGGEI